jgi:hypothetical protein
MKSDAVFQAMAESLEIQAAIGALETMGISVMVVEDDPEHLGMGMEVRIRFNPKGIFAKECGRHGPWDAILHNVTEVHHAYDWDRRQAGAQRVAFESTIHGTGLNYSLSDLLEYEVVPSIVLADSF